MMNDRDVSKAIEFADDRVDVRRVHPRIFHDLVFDPVLPCNLSDTFAVHTVFNDQQTPAFRHHAGNHAFNGGRARTGHQDGRPDAGVECVSS